MAKHRFMAKHRRLLPKRAPSKAVRKQDTRHPVARRSGVARRAAGGPATAGRVAVRPAAGRVTARPATGRSVKRPSAKPTETRSSLHDDAVRHYQWGVEALQQRDYSRASDLFVSVLERYPDEKELHERVRLYLNVCRRQAAPPDPTPKSLEERLYAATLAINAGAYEGGLSQLQAALLADSGNDHVHYMLAVVHALRLDFAASMAHLRRAIEINPENRFLALQDADLVGLRETEPSFRTIVDTVFSARRERREARPRTSR